MSGPFLALALVPTLLFVGLVMPMWLAFHYRSKRHASSQLSEDERRELESLADKAESFAERIEVLESILDDQVPDWRGRSESNASNEKS